MGKQDNKRCGITIDARSICSIASLKLLCMFILEASFQKQASLMLKWDLYILRCVTLQDKLKY